MERDRQYTSSEEYRQMLVRDGQKRYDEWHHQSIAHSQEFEKTSKIDKYSNASIPKVRLNSEQYRQMLVRDGQRRYDEWHSNFLAYQKQFLNK